MSFCKAQTYAFACEYIVLIGAAPPLCFSTCRKSLRGNCLVYICRPPVHLHLKSSADAHQYCASVPEQSMYVYTYTNVMTFTMYIRQPSLRGETSPLLNNRPRNETLACRRPCRRKLVIPDVSCIISKVLRYTIAQITNLVSSVF